MKFVVKILVVILLCYILQLFLPWWIIAVVPFIVEAAFPSSKGYPFFVGFYAVFILWFTQAMIVHLQTDAVLTERIAVLFSLQSMPWAVVLATGLIGGLLGGLSSLTGSYFNRAFLKKEKA